MQTIPRGVLLSVQPEDVHRFLRLLAKHPTETFDDAGVVLECVAALRARRVTAALATVAYVSRFARARACVCACACAVAGEERLTFWLCCCVTIVWGRVLGRVL